MSLKIHYGSRIEGLAEKLKACLLEDRRGADPFEPSKVVVPNGNVATWLKIRQFASEPSLCAGIEFPFMEKRLTELLVDGLPEAERNRVQLIPDQAYAKAIVSILMEGSNGPSEADGFAPFRRYFEEGGAQKRAEMTWQLADRLADLMDSYDVHRPKIVEAWLGKGKGPENLRQDETAKAEAALARALWGTQGRFKPDGDQLSLRQLYNRVKDGAPGGTPQKVYFFGQSTLSLLQTEILAWLARTHEVVVFHYNLCREYWGDITCRKEDLKELMALRGIRPQETGADGKYQYSNVLLKEFGIAGRETLGLLVDLEEQNGNEADASRRIDFRWDAIGEESEGAETVLGKVQASVRDCTSTIEPRCRQDASVQVIGTPGTRREVEMVYNSILGSVARPKGVEGERPWPDCSFSDIAVVVPDMKTYRSVIETVFDARGEVPYGLLDTSASEDSHYLRGFLDLIALGREGLNRERLFNVLENQCVQRALGFSRADVVGWRELTEKIGAFDGFEHDERNGYFDWSSALRHLRLSRLVDKVVENGDELPLAVEGGEGALKLSEVVELLYRDLSDTLFDGQGAPRQLPLVAARPEDGVRPDCWADRLVRLAKTFLDIDRDDRLETAVCQSLSRTLYSLGEIPGTHDFELAVAAVAHFVGGMTCNKGKYLTSGVTIGTFASLNTLPFKQVYVMGLGAGGFPGRTSSSTLDIRGTGWELGDVSTPNRNRFLFLETLMSVRDRLVLSYPNLDVEKDAELFPAGIVREVEKFIGEHVLEYGAEPENEEKRFREFKGYPLLERGEVGPCKAGEGSPTDDIVWNQDDCHAGLLPTYSAAARKLAQARAEGRGRLPEVKEPDSGQDGARREISVKELAEFLRNPVRAVMRHRFGINVVGYVETDLNPDSPLGTPDGPDLWNLQAKWLETDGDKAVEQEIRRLQLTGGMPTGFLGDFARQTFMEGMTARLAAVQAFVQGFTLSNGQDGTLHLDCPTELGRGGAEKLNVRLVAEIPNCQVSETEMSVLVTGSLDDKDATGKSPAKTQRRPGDRCFEPFLAYLTYLLQSGTDNLSLRVGVVDLQSGKTGIWTWRETSATARGYLAALVRTYLAYDRKGVMTDLSGKRLLTALNEVKQKDAWDDILEKLTAEDGDSSDKSFNNDLVIEQNLLPFKRNPESGEELKKIYEDRYALPLGGKRLEAGAEEVDHE